MNSHSPVAAVADSPPCAGIVTAREMLLVVRGRLVERGIKAKTKNPRKKSAPCAKTTHNHKKQAPREPRRRGTTTKAATINLDQGDKQTQARKRKSRLSSEVGREVKCARERVK